MKKVSNQKEEKEERQKEKEKAWNYDIYGIY